MHISLDELNTLCDVMVSLCRAGVPLDRGLEQLARELPGRLGPQAEEISQQLRDGKSLADVVARDRGPLPAVYASVLEAGLRSGRSTAALEGFARLARQLAEMRSLVVAALVYPLVLLVVVALISMTLLPQLPTVFRDFLEDHLRGTTAYLNYEAILAGYQIAAQWFWVLPVTLLCVGVFWIVATRSAKAAQGEGPDWIAWVPGAGRLLRNSRLMAFTKVLQLLVEQGVPLHDAVRLSGSASGDRYLRHDAGQLAEQMQRGERGGELSDTKKRGIPVMLRWAIGHRQQAGELEAALERAGETYRLRTEDSVTWLRTFLPVYFSLALGGFVGVTYAALFLIPWLRMLRLIAEPLSGLH